MANHSTAAPAMVNSWWPAVRLASFSGALGLDLMRSHTILPCLISQHVFAFARAFFDWICRDIRNPQHMLGSFEELHTQDVLQVRFHPLRPSRLFSGGEDGLIAELDLLQADPDEAVETSCVSVLYRALLDCAHRKRGIFEE